MRPNRRIGELAETDDYPVDVDVDAAASTSDGFNQAAKPSGWAFEEAEGDSMFNSKTDS
jgi:hypothetical protein